MLGFLICFQVLESQQKYWTKGMGIQRPWFLLEEVKKLETVMLKNFVEGLIFKKHVLTEDMV